MKKGKKRCQHDTLKGTRCKRFALVGNACRIHVRMIMKRIREEMGNG